MTMPLHGSLPANTFELHIHTSEVSSCAVANAVECVRRCVKLGYAGMVVTDHISCDRAVNKGIASLPWKEQCAFWFRGYFAAKAAAPAGFVVLPGAEFSFPGSINDYLLYGMEEDFLPRHKHIDKLTFLEFAEKVRKAGLLFAQAHPFRFGLELVHPDFLEGMEVYNGNAHHESNNPIAEAWARRWSLLPLSGSDWHGGDTGVGRMPGGVVFPYPVHTAGEMLQALRAREYTLLKE